MKVKRIVAPKNVIDMKWEEIKKCLINFLEPMKRLLIAERTHFMTMKQDEGEPISGFAARLREQAMVCEFEKFKDATSQPAEQLIKMRLISGLNNQAISNKILEKELTHELNVDQITEYVQRLNQVNEFVTAQEKSATSETKIQGSEVQVNNSQATQEDQALHAVSSIRFKCNRCGLARHQRPAEETRRRSTYRSRPEGLSGARSLKALTYLRW